MRHRNEWENCLDVDGTEAQRLFEACFPAGHVIMTDTRTPKAIESGLSPEEWREIYDLRRDC